MATNTAKIGKPHEQKIIIIYTIHQRIEKQYIFQSNTCPGVIGPEITIVNGKPQLEQNSKGLNPRTATHKCSID
jgi:hypothetical protein